MILFFGPPGSGKSIQGKMLVKRNNWQWISTGQLFRQSTDSEVVRRRVAGELIDDNLTSSVLAEALSKIRDKDHVVLDGFPRNTWQAKWLEENLPDFGRDIKCLVVFKVPNEEIIRRLADRGREEDKPEIIKKRLGIYQKQTEPVLQFYRNKNIPIINIDGMGSVEVVHERIQSAVETCLRA